MSNTQLSDLGVLDLSFNSLSGRIPRRTQLESFDVPSYTENPALCGLPLPNECPGDETRSINPRDENVVEQEHDDKFISRGFFVSIAVGFAFGVFGFYGSLALIDSWRYVFFGFFTLVGNWVLVTIEINFNKIKRRARRKCC
ncbi:receptor-like protein EIX2 [Rutidosis leptorrhynchoides]|uniref:receptor-like protein EIX2 n=1 Tax=Rutidosis leptorrhynchoides TaxID=125765 RepID=UPI003A998C46